MSVKDDPNTRVKAVEARRAMERMPRAGHEFCSSLVSNYQLQGVVILNFNGGEEAGVSVCCFDSRGRDILHAWAANVAKRAPEKVTDLLGAYVLAIRDDGGIDTATWGSSREACDAIAAWRDASWEYVSAAPFQTWFGWGNGGVPKRLSAEELDSLGESGRAYVQSCTHPNAIP